METIINGSVSLWWQQIARHEPFGPLVGGVDADVCIVGGGLTGLWTAYYLAHARPQLRIVVLEAEFAGYGASGRNGGWLAASLSGSRNRYAAGPGGVDAFERMEAEAARTVDEVISVCAKEGINADIVKSGLLLASRNGAQMQRMRSLLPSVPDAVELTAEEFRSRIAVDKVQGGSFHANYARVHPAKLVDGLTRVVSNLGVTIHEGTRVHTINPNEAISDRGRVRATHVLRCLEGYSALLNGQRRTWLPLNSAMVVTEPLSDAVWEDIGWQGCELLGDNANVYFYAQRTPDGRVALGGRGVPYRYGSRVDVDGRTQARTIASLRRTLDDVFPPLRQVRISHAWCGVLGVPRDWCATVGVDERTGLGWAGGFVGSGLTATNLAARTLRDLVLGDRSPLTTLAWANRPTRKWEPEPFRWLGVSTAYALSRQADRREVRTNRPSRLSALAHRISGRD